MAALSDTSATQFFFDLTPERILDVVEGATGMRCTGRVLALNSMENRVYEVELEGDSEVSFRSRWDDFRVVKFYRPGRWSKAQIEDEHRFLLECRSRELPVVAPLPLQDGTTIGALANPEIFYAVFPKVGGRILDEMSDDQLRQIGRLIARMHAVGAASPHQQRLRLDPATYGFANLDFLRSNKMIPLTVEAHYSGLAERLLRAVEPWFLATGVQRIHGDCHIGNILWGGTGPQLVDFDDTLTGPPVQDLWLLTPGRDQESLQKREVLLEGYEQMWHFDRASLRLVEPLRALRMIHFTAWIGRRYDDPAFKRIFVEYGSERYWREQLIALQEVGEQLGIG